MITELEPARNLLQRYTQQTKAEDNEEISFGDKSLPQLNRASEIYISPCAPPNCKWCFDDTLNDNPAPLDKYEYDGSKGARRFPLILQKGNCLQDKY
ncbi:hypothetical protein CEXT_37211 [Caerostris extrusa]|uniref:Uncharacterized protein n=1 Tax=Caerostris extrusa TaxID=172846 RepID=A0AAV4NTA3_CAEEX|nr:hypothetical protein CEXT_37211 [Caerostris extrusa]